MTYSYEREVFLPSLGKPYGVESGNCSARVTPWTTKEEKLLAGANLTSNTLINKLIENVTQLPPGIQVQDLTINDRLFLLLNIRSVSYGPEYSYQYKCENCNSQETVHMNLEQDLDTVELPEDFEYENWKVHLENADRELQLRHLTGKDEAVIAQHVHRAKKKGSIVGDPEYHIRMALRITHIDGNQVDLRKRLEFVESLISRDSLDLQAAFEEYDFGVQLEVEPSCTNCGWINDLVLPFNKNFFRPTTSTRSKRVSRSRVPSPSKVEGDLHGSAEHASLRESGIDQ